MTTFDVSGRVAFVTGTNKKNGIGRAIVHELLKAGAKKVYATARDASQLEDLVEQSGGRVEAVSLDVTDERATAKLGKSYPDVQLLVNNAGLFGAQQGVAESAKAEMEVNYLGPLRITESFASVLRGHAGSGDKAGSAVVNINSIASLTSFAIGSTYSASKAAAHSLTQAQRRELAPSLVVGVYPGPIDTHMAEGIPMDKAPPSAVGEAVVAALRSGEEDVFPDPTAAQVYGAWKQDFKALEAQMAAPQG